MEYCDGKRAPGGSLIDGRPTRQSEHPIREWPHVGHFSQRIRRLGALHWQHVQTSSMVIDFV